MLSEMISWRTFLSKPITAKNIRGFAEISRKRISRSQFGSIYETDIPTEKPLRPVRNFDSLKPSTSKQTVRVLTTKPSRIGESPASEADPDVIVCSRKEFNKNRYDEHGLVLFSRYWEKNKYQNQWIKLRQISRKATVDALSSPCSWNEFVPDLLDESVAFSLRELNLKYPTEIQARMLKYFSSENHLFLAAETGSGKTVAYGAPLISHLSRQKKKGLSQRGVVLVATSSLCQQTSAVLSVLAERTGLSVATANNKNQCSLWDILVGTPGLVTKTLGTLSTTDVSHLIFDEADMLLDQSFVDVITDVLSLVPVAHSETNISGNRKDGAKVIFCSASCPEDLECIAEGVVDRQKLSYVKSAGLHKLLPSVDLTFIRMKEMDKFERLCKLLDGDIKRGKLGQTIVFCKDKGTARFVSSQLVASGRDTFLWQSTSSPAEVENAQVIVATDAASRGVDLPCLSHVIQYDMAKHVVDFLHRMGRVGRLSSQFPGRMTAFVRTAPEIRVTNIIETAARRGKPLTSIETDIAGMLEGKKGGENE